MVQKNKICFVVSVYATINAFMKNHIKVLATEFDVSLVGNLSEDEIKEALHLGFSSCKSIPLKRNINIISDIVSVFQLIRYFRKERFYSIHSITPKAGLLCALSSYIARIPNRIHIFTGQVWATKNGVGRCIFRNLDKLIVFLNNKILVDGESQRLFLTENGVLKKDQGEVLGCGSISGVDTDRFTPNPEVRLNLRKEIGIPDGFVVYSFLGRLNIDKGIPELFKAFSELVIDHSNVFLLIIGVDEQSMLSILKDYPRIIEGVNFCFYGFSKEPENILQASDIFCLPSHREGFGSSVIEASCLEIPVICSDAYGLRDAFIENKTGLKHGVGDHSELKNKMEFFLLNPSRILEMGANGRKNVLTNFSSSYVSECWLNYYKSL